MIENARTWRALTAAAALTVLVALFLPWTRDCSSPGPGCQTTHGWSPQLGVAVGVISFAVLTASRMDRPRIARELALAAAFFSGVLIFQARPSHQGNGQFSVDRMYAYGAWVGIAAALAMLVSAAIWAAGGKTALIGELPGWARVDRL